MNGLEGEKQALRQKYLAKNKDFERLYKEFGRHKEENELKGIRLGSEVEKMGVAMKELERKYLKEREIGQNLERYNRKLLEENEIVVQERANALSS